MSDQSAEARRETVRRIIFEADTPAGKAFDVALLFAIVLSVAAVMLESVNAIQSEFGDELRLCEWIFTGLFSVEYVVRLWCVRRPRKYATSFFGVVDLVAVIPTYLELILTGTGTLTVIRALRLLRAFRILGLGPFVREADAMRNAFAQSRARIAVFLSAVLIIEVIMGTLMYIIEGPENGFTSIPKSVYWAIVTMTTVGYGDLYPVTALGKSLAATAMFLGYSLILIPTGFITAEVIRGSGQRITTKSCGDCTKQGHEHDARYCKHCGSPL
jgi:voltage-gated potassium channel